MFTTTGLASLFAPNLAGGINGPNPANPDPRTNYTGGLSYTAPQAYNSPGDPNNRNGQGPQFTQYNTLPTTELAGHRTISGYFPPPSQQAPAQAPTGNPLSITQLQPFHQNGPAVNVAGNLAQHMPAPMPKPHEPTQQFSTEGQWAGGNWYSNGAPAGMQPVWQQSYNGGNTWSNDWGAPKQSAGGQAPGSGWAQMNNGGDSPQWIQRA